MLKSWTPGEMPDREEMKIQLEKTKSSLYDLQMKIKEHKLPVLVLFEGWSAAGKGSMIGKVIKNIDPRFFKVATMSSPTEEELRAEIETQKAMFYLQQKEEDLEK